MRPSTKIRSKLAATVRHMPGDVVTIEQLRSEHRASLAAEYLQEVLGVFPPLTQEQISELQDVLASRATGSTEHRKSVDEYRGHGRTQWDAWTEATSDGKFRVTRLALLMSVRYWPRAGVGVLAYQIIKMLSHHH